MKRLKPAKQLILTFSFLKGMRPTLLLTCILLFVFIQTSFASLTLPRLVSDHMVLQREIPVKIWGWAFPGEEVTVNLLDYTLHDKADSTGYWQVIMPAHPAGGPYDMRIWTTHDFIMLNDILFGDVWVCSGQSNMELNMERVSPLYEEIIAGANYQKLRYFTVQKTYDFQGPRDTVGGGAWTIVTPETVRQMSATAFFFGRDLHARYDIPVGLIVTAFGGSPAQAWVSEEALEDFPDYLTESRKYRDKRLIDSITKSEGNLRAAWYGRARKEDQGYLSSEAPWFKMDLDDSNWDQFNVPGWWDDGSDEAENGVTWFRREFEISQAMAGKEVKLLLGRVIDADSVYINGVFVGTTSYQYPPRRYTIPEGILLPGKNQITVRQIDSGGRSGFMPDKPYLISVDSDTIDLRGPWKARRGVNLPALPGSTFFAGKSFGLYNAMVFPLTRYSIKGVIWYQGESNASRPGNYAALMRTLITDWREKWGQGDFPFLMVQLPNFGPVTKTSQESNWAELREQQAITLDLPNTALAVTIDLGEWNDIHPLNKKDVGERLALQARKMVYGERIRSSGPSFKDVRFGSGKALVTFDHVNSGLLTSDGKSPRHFELAGEDGIWHTADARILDNAVVLSAEQVPEPVAVRYAWADNPGKVNMYNGAGLPTAPFRSIKDSHRD